jgi:hypothetical protein
MERAGVLNVLLTQPSGTVTLLPTNLKTHTKNLCLGEHASSLPRVHHCVLITAQIRVNSFSVKTHLLIFLPFPFTPVFVPDLGRVVCIGRKSNHSVLRKIKDLLGLGLYHQKNGS